MAHALQQPTTESFFQCKPRLLVKGAYGWEQRPCVFQNHAFDLSALQYISPVGSLTTTLYRFSITLTTQACSIDSNGAPVPTNFITFDFSTKGEALKAQRELSRAYCEYGEYERTDVQSGVSGSSGQQVDGA